MSSCSMLGVDEDPTIQALERARGYVQSSSGKVVQSLKSTYKRHGPSTSSRHSRWSPPWFAARLPRAKKRSFPGVQAEIVSEHPADRQVHAILDNLCTHKKNDNWLAARPNVTFDFTPT